MNEEEDKHFGKEQYHNLQANYDKDIEKFNVERKKYEKLIEDLKLQHTAEKDKIIMEKDNILKQMKKEYCTAIMQEKHRNDLFEFQAKQKAEIEALHRE